MKSSIAIILCLVSVLLFAGCGKKKNDPAPETTADSQAETVTKAKTLREKYPEYFELSDFKGIEVYVWQVAENSYRCGMMSGTNRLKTDKEISALQQKALSVEEAKGILAEMGIEKERIVVCPISQADSDYAYAVDDEYQQRVSELFR